MLFGASQEVTELKTKLLDFMDSQVYPSEERFYREAEELGPWKVYPVVDELKPLAGAQGVWNLFLPEGKYDLSNLEYAPLCELMGSSHFAPEIFNCSASDTGNMEVLVRYGTKEHQERRLLPSVSRDDRVAVGPAISWKGRFHAGQNSTRNRR